MLVDKNRHAGTRLLRLRLVLAATSVCFLAALAATSPAFLVSAGQGGGQAGGTATSAQRPKFEVASVKPCKPGDLPPGGRGGAPQSSPGRLTVACQPARFFIASAYIRGAHGGGTINPNIEGLPPWGSSERFTISAEVPGDASQEMMMGPMMQSLLEDRFKLKIHAESREVPVYDLTVAKGGLKLPQMNPDAVCRNGFGKPWDPSNCTMVTAPTAISDFATNLPMDIVGRPVIDKTGVTGTYIIRMVSSWPGMPQTADEPSIFTALKEQLGLELTPSKGPQSTIVIDHIEEPTPN